MEAPQKLQYNFERVCTLIEPPSGMRLQRIQDLMTPLLSGEMTPEQHEAWLLTQLAEGSAS